MTLKSKKITAYLPQEIVVAIKNEAANKGKMHYSVLISNKLDDAFVYFRNIQTFTELSNKFSNVISHFIPSKVGRPCSREIKQKTAVTLFLANELHTGISRYAKKYSLSKSSLIELSIRISNSAINNGMPLNIKISDFDKVLLNELMTKTGAEEISEFLHACNFDWIVEEIRKNIDHFKKLDTIG